MNPIKNIAILVSQFPVREQKIGPLCESKERGPELITHQSSEILLQLVVVRSEEVCCEDVHTSLFSVVSKFQTNFGVVFN